MVKVNRRFAFEELDGDADARSHPSVTLTPHLACILTSCVRGDGSRNNSTTLARDFDCTSLRPHAHHTTMADDDLEAIRAARRQQLQSQAGPSGGGGGGGGGDEQQQKQEAQCVESFRETFYHEETSS
jgi:hypothetical protein